MMNGGQTNVLWTGYLSHFGGNGVRSLTAPFLTPCSIAIVVELYEMPSSSDFEDLDPYRLWVLYILPPRGGLLLRPREAVYN